MMVNYTFFFIFLFCLGCKSAHSPKSFIAEYKTVYINKFKLTYFKQLLKKSYNNSNAIREIISQDHSGFTEPILSEADYRFIDSLTTAENNHIRVDSAQGNNRAEGAEGKRPLGYILDRLSSKWLDSTAKRRLKLSKIPKSWSD